MTFRTGLAVVPLAIATGALFWTQTAGADAGAVAGAQRSTRLPASTRRIATVASLAAYPVFFHLQTVRVRGDLGGIGGPTPWKLIGGQGTNANHEVMVIPSQNAKIGGTADGKLQTYDVTGVFLDVGRLEQGHPRATQELIALSEKLLKKSWPGVGELTVLVAESAVPAEPLAAPSLRNVALEPSRYFGSEVTVTGRFRGRNLYGDLPDAPNLSRWDFVLQSADAAIWVTGRRPRAEGIDLSPERRADTGQWLQVRGTVHEERGLVRIEALDLRPATPPAAAPEDTVVQVPDKGPPPEVVFSAPTQDETDVEPTTTLRIQFSRDLDPPTIKDQVRLAYVGFVPGDPNWQPPPFAATYDTGRRMLELKFKAPFEPNRKVQVRLLEGIKGTDGQPLAPWTLNFEVGR
jgi:hypothetical protein